MNGEDDTRVLRHAYLNSYFQTGYKNLMDIAIIRKTEEEEAADPRLLDLSENYVKVDEIPFDFTRRRLTTVVQDKTGKTQMVTKEPWRRCSPSAPMPSVTALCSR